MSAHTLVHHCVFTPSSLYDASQWSMYLHVSHSSLLTFSPFQCQLSIYSFQHNSNPYPHLILPTYIHLVLTPLYTLWIPLSHDPHLSLIISSQFQSHSTIYLFQHRSRCCPHPIFLTHIPLILTPPCISLNEQPTHITVSCHSGTIIRNYSSFNMTWL